MRYIGNKTKLLPFIRTILRRLGVRGGIAHDAFAGTAAVGCALKADGWRVMSSDVLVCSYVFQRAYVAAERTASVTGLAAGDRELRRALRSPALRASAAERGGGALAGVCTYLDRWLEPERGFVSQHFGPASGRLYFTEENAGRIDAARRQLHDWHAAALLGTDAFYTLLAALIEGADRVANTAGVYASYIKRLQSNAARPLTLVPRAPVAGVGSVALCADAVETATALGEIDLLYVDPPYNTRQYAAYYHIPEIIARGWFPEPPRLQGSVGLFADRVGWSQWGSKRKGPGLLTALLAATGARHVVVSYNDEGVIPDATLRSALGAAAVDGEVRRFVRRHRRYRADSVRPGRQYTGTSVNEQLYYARLR
ncbi:MAG: DNA adenine methylase [Gemmatimonadaceae bacterium]